MQRPFSLQLFLLDLGRTLHIHSGLDLTGIKRSFLKVLIYTHTHTHTHIYIYIYIYIYIPTHPPHTQHRQTHISVFWLWLS